VDLTFLYPAYNRASLFIATLDSHLDQVGRTVIPYEIVVVDDGSSDGLLELVQDYRARSLPLRYFRIDTSRFVDYPIYKTSQGANNPALAINVGIRRALGNWLVFSSPEVTLSNNYDLEGFYTFTQQGHSESTALLCDVWDEGFQSFICGGPDQRPFHFLAIYNRDFVTSIGGMEEAYVSGWGYEDTEFLDRVRRHGLTMLFDRSLTGCHQAHPRAEFSEASAAFGCSGVLYHQHAGDQKRMVANAGRDWGSESLIVNRWP